VKPIRETLPVVTQSTKPKESSPTTAVEEKETKDGRRDGSKLLASIQRA